MRFRTHDPVTRPRAGNVRDADTLRLRVTARRRRLRQARRAWLRAALQARDEKAGRQILDAQLAAKHEPAEALRSRRGEPGREDGKDPGGMRNQRHDGDDAALRRGTGAQHDPAVRQATGVVRHLALQEQVRIRAAEAQEPQLRQSHRQCRDHAIIHVNMVPKPRTDTAFSGRISAVMQPQDPAAPAPAPAAGASPVKPLPPRQREVGGPAGPEPTRYGDWELRGRCIDF